MRASNQIRLVDDFTIIKQGDTANSFIVQLLGRDGQPKDLTGATVTWTMARTKNNKRGVVLSKPAIIDNDPTTGTVTLNITQEDSTGAGEMEVEITVDNNGVIEKFPGYGHLELTISDSLDNIEETPVSYATLSFFTSQVNTAEQASTAAQTAAQNAETKVNEVQKTLEKLIITYDQFGAALDGITDDTQAIQQAHDYANANGYPIVQKNATFVLNGTVEVQTDVDLTGSTLITTWNQPGYEYNRTNYLFNITGNPLTDITNSVLQSEFTKGDSQISSLQGQESGSVIMKTTDVDIKRNNNGITDQYKQECNLLLKNDAGDLVYPLTKDYSSSSGFQVFLRKDDESLTFRLPKVVLEGSGLYTLAKVKRNNVELTGGSIEESNTSATISPLYTIAEFEDCSRISISDITCPVLGRNDKTGENGLGYLFLFTRVSNIKIDRVYQIRGWSGVNGNWFRDIEITNCSVVTIGGHVCVYDMSIRDCRIFKRVIVHGGGILEVARCRVDGRQSPVSISTRQDYGGEFEGIFRIRDCDFYESETIFEYVPLTYDPGRSVTFPDVEIDNCTMHNTASKDTKVIKFSGYTANYPSSLPKISVSKLDVKTGDYRCKIVDFPTISNPSLNGLITVNIKDTVLPKESYAGNIFDPNFLNIVLPNITNASVKMDYNIENSTGNFPVNGTSNIYVKCKNSDVYGIRTNLSSATTVGDPLVFEFENCTLHRPACNLGTLSGYQGRVRASVMSSSFVRFKKLDGTYDNQIGFTFENIIVFSKNNRVSADGNLPGTNAQRLFNYADTSIWKDSV